MGLGIRGQMAQVIQVMVVVGGTVPLSVVVVVAIKMMTVVGLG